MEKNSLNSTRKNSCGYRRKRRNRKKRFLRIITAAMILIACVCISCGTFLVSAKEDTSCGTENAQTVTYYKSIEIRSGDSLWDIASNHMTSQFSSVEEYVQYIMQLNNLKTDMIYSGHHLIIPYETSVEAE